MQRGGEVGEYRVGKIGPDGERLGSVNTKSAKSEAEEKNKWSILARIMMVQQKLYETHLGENLREKENALTEHKFQMKYLDQELIMIKIEMALLKCQLEESQIE